jgi:sulfur-oxidizing protein SoxX
LPAGNYEAGLAAFVELGCSSCHSVAGLSEFDRPAEYEGLLVPLGGELRIVKTYGELVTAIIHPTESIRPDIYKQYVDINGKSLMPDLTWQMSARQVIDMVAFLEEHYEVMTPEYPANYYPYGGAVHP